MGPCFTSPIGCSLPAACLLRVGFGHHPLPWYSEAQDNMSPSPSTWQGQSMRRESLQQAHTHLWVLENGRAPVIATPGWSGITPWAGGWPDEPFGGVQGAVRICINLSNTSPKGEQHQLANKTSQVEKETYREILKLHISIPLTALFSPPFFFSTRALVF